MHKEHMTSELNVSKKKWLRDQRKNKATAGRSNHGKHWDGRDIARLFCNALTDAQLAEELGRSLRGIRDARERYIYYAPVGYKSKQHVRK